MAVWDAGGEDGEQALGQSVREWLAMVVGGVWGRESACLRLLTPCARLGRGRAHGQFPRHLWHLPRDYGLAIRWLRPSFLS